MNGRINARVKRAAFTAPALITALLVNGSAFGSGGYGPPYSGESSHGCNRSLIPSVNSTCDSRADLIGESGGFDVAVRVSSEGLAPGTGHGFARAAYLLPFTVAKASHRIDLYLTLKIDSARASGPGTAEVGFVTDLRGHSVKDLTLSNAYLPVANSSGVGSVEQRDMTLHVWAESDQAIPPGTYAAVFQANAVSYLGGSALGATSLTAIGTVTASLSAQLTRFEAQTS